MMTIAAFHPKEVVIDLFELELTQASFIALLKIIAIDIVLSGDNAVVIAMATKRLPKQQQNKAIVIGTGGAVLLRIFLAVVVTYLLQVPLVHFIGGMLLLFIAYNVLADKKDKHPAVSSNGLSKAVWTIIIADAVMSLDNVVAIAGAADGHVLMIALGVAVSIPIMIFGSKLIVLVMNKYRWIAYAGAGILAWTAGEMITRDKIIINLFNLHQKSFVYVIIAGLTALILLIGYLKNHGKLLTR
jgi:YjbE family integral membrane protein